MTSSDPSHDCPDPAPHPLPSGVVEAVDFGNLVLLAAGALEAAGLIQNMRGTVKILNRKSLEESACECYGVIQHFNGGLGLK